ncbi:AMP-binding protein, partial [Rhodococcus sp. EPR-134]
MPLQSQSETEQSFGIPSVFLRSAHAPAPRTLIDIVRASAEANPEAPAIDDGDTTLSYSELLDEIALGARWLGDAGVGAGDRVGIRMPSGSRSLYVAILSILAAGAAYVPVDADDPEE